MSEMAEEKNDAKAKGKPRRKGGAADRPAMKRKQERVSALARLMKKYKTIAVVDLRELPDRQFSGIRKKLRGRAEFAVAKNTLIKRAFEKAKVAGGLVGHVNAPSALIFTNMNPFELFNFLFFPRDFGGHVDQVGQIDVHLHARKRHVRAKRRLRRAGADCCIRRGQIDTARRHHAGNGGGDFIRNGQ